MAEELIIPPIQQSLEDLESAKSNGTDPPMTAKSWYLYWQRTGRLVNLHSRWIARLVSYGPHADRPDPGTWPDAALYMETDRDVIYQNIDGSWQYVAGTMWGTMTPDERPTDLGVHDGGFDFRSTDLPAREFLWSQTVWVEVTGYTDPLTTKGDLVIRTASITTRLPVGTDGQVLTADSAQTGGVRWAAAAGGGGSYTDPLTTKGDIVVRGTTTTRLPVGTDGQVLTADSTQTLGVKWAAAGGGSLTPWTSDIDANGYKLMTIASSNKDLVFATNAVERMRILSTGFVGIGTATPARALEVRASNLNIFGGLGSGNDGGVSLMAFGNVQGTSDFMLTQSASGNDAYVWNRAAANLIFGSNNAEKMRITAAGNVLIAAAANLSIGGAWNSGLLQMSNCYLWVDSGGRLRIKSAAVPTGDTDGAVVGSGVTSVFTRTGAVVAAAGDYTAAQVTNAVSTIGSYADPAWLTALAWSKITGAPATGVSTVFGRSGAVTAQSGDYTAAQVTGAVPNTVQVIAGTGLTGGGALSGNVTLNANIAAIQTPWTSNINAANFQLQNAGYIDVAGNIRSRGNAVSGPVVSVSNQHATSRNATLSFTYGATPTTGWSVSTDFSGSGSTELNVVNAAGTRVMTFLQSGFVGIGIATPGVALDCLGNIRSGGNAVSGPAVAIWNSNATSRNCSLNFTYGASASANWSLSTDYSGNGGTEINVINAAGTRVMIFQQNGNVSIGGAWNTGVLQMSNCYLWVDSSGRLRIKSAAVPTSDTDGVVVGSQT